MYNVDPGTSPLSTENTNKDATKSPSVEFIDLSIYLSIFIIGRCSGIVYGGGRKRCHSPIFYLFSAHPGGVVYGKPLRQTQRLAVERDILSPFTAVLERIIFVCSCRFQ